jgi:hypothetical protein
VSVKLRDQPQLIYGYQRVYRDGPIEVYRSVAA